MAFIRVHTICHQKRFCGELQLSGGLNSAREITEPIWQTSETLEVVYKKERIVCLAQKYYHVEEKCRLCLREASDSKSIGEFLFAARGDFHSVYVLRTLHTRDEIAEACSISQNCQKIVKNIYRDDLCNAIHNTGVSKYYKSEDILVTELDPNAQIQNVPNVHCVVAESKRDFSNGRMDYHDIMKDCMACIAKKTNSLVHRMRISAEPVGKIYFLFTVEDDYQDSYSCDTCTIEEAETEECYIGYERKFDTIPIGEQVSVNMDSKLRKNNKLDPRSSCHVAHYDMKLRDACMECLQEFYPKKFGYGSRMLVIWEESHYLAKCITSSGNPACMRFIFVDDRICRGNSPAYSKISVKEMMLRGYPREVASTSWSYKADPPGNSINDLTRYDIVSALYDDKECLFCLALKMNILAISFQNKLFWAKEETQETLDCRCEYKKIERFPIYNYNSMRPIPEADIRRRLKVNPRMADVATHSRK